MAQDAPAVKNVIKRTLLEGRGGEVLLSILHTFIRVTSVCHPPHSEHHGAQQPDEHSIHHRIYPNTFYKIHTRARHGTPKTSYRLSDPA